MLILIQLQRILLDHRHGIIVSTKSKMIFSQSPTGWAILRLTQVIRVPPCKWDKKCNPRGTGRWWGQNQSVPLKKEEKLPRMFASKRFFGQNPVLHQSNFPRMHNKPHKTSRPLLNCQILFLVLYSSTTALLGWAFSRPRAHITFWNMSGSDTDTGRKRCWLWGSRTCPTCQCCFRSIFMENERRSSTKESVQPRQYTLLCHIQ